MILKDLEIYGFKTFAEKTRIVFGEGITAIAGPNGCGKSNLVDAIKWVLGEQRPTALRGASMEDVIFNGTNNRESINIAEVYLTLSNEDKSLPIEYDEVRVGRRVYRSGESDYFLNKQRVRLKDIQDLFHGSGIGTSSYSVIEQGKIDLVLSSKSEDRRFVFEEAAGITRYKAKKEEALRKLQHTQENLQRVNDIIKEVERQVRLIERQAKKAEKYKEKFEKLKVLEVKNSYRQYLQLKNKNNDTLSQKESFKKEEEHLLSVIGDTDRKINQARENLRQIGQKLSQLQTQKIKLAGNIENNSSKVQLNQERIKELKDKLTSLEKQRLTYEEKAVRLKKQLESFESQISSIEQNKAEKNKSLEENQQILSNLRQEIDSSTRLIKEKKATIIDLANHESKLNNELTESKAALQNLDARLRRLKLEKQDVETEKQQDITKKEELENGMQEIVNKLEQFNSEKAELEEQFQRLTKKINDLNNKISELTNQFASYKSKLQFLEDLKKRLEGYAKPVKTLLIYKKENKLPFDGIRDSLANVVNVKEGYEVAVEVCLKEHAQSILTDTAEQAEQAISFLKANNIGWVNFLPLSKYQNLNLVTNKKLLERTKGPLADYIETSDEYKKVISYLLRDTYCVESKVEAKELLKSIPMDKSNIRLVTKEGEIFTKISLSGGGYSPEEELSLIGRSAKIEKVKVKSHQTEQEIKNLQSNLQDDERNHEELQVKIEELNQQIHLTDIKRANLQSEITRIDEETKKFNDELTLLNDEIDEAESDKNSLTEKQTKYQAELENVRQQNSEVQNIITSNQGSIKEKTDRLQNVLLQITEIKTELSSIDELYNNKKDTRNVFKNSIQETEENITDIKLNYETSQERIGQLEKEVSNLSLVNQDLAKEKISFDERIKATTAEQDSMLANLKELESQLRNKQTELTGIRENLHNFDVTNTEYAFRVDNLKDRILNTYKVDLDEVKMDIDESDNWQKIDEDIAKLSKQIESMGNVNLVALDEHKELKERFEFLTHQRQDLEEAKDSLNQTIRKINKTTIELFKQTFEQIRVSFKEFFRMLFGGGKAELRLVDEGNVLESGIDIIARPPGKKTHNISLLSGGEKALSAIALLFAIFKVKPSPFCVLDEIDAALDESNVDRFTRVLQDFIKTSQFIIITHNKKTIGMANVIYGVTMQESGVSKLVSVKFTEPATI